MKKVYLEDDFIHQQYVGVFESVEVAREAYAFELGCMPEDMIVNRVEDAETGVVEYDEKCLDDVLGKHITAGTYNIGFTHEGFEDETQFDIASRQELVDCWTDFCKENTIDVNKAVYVEKV